MSNDDQHLFSQNMRDVTPLKQKPRVGVTQQVPKPLPKFSKRAHDNAIDDAMTAPSFDSVNSADSLSWHQVGIQKAILRKLKRGHYAIRDELDLHGLQQQQAQKTLYAFLNHANEQGFSCVRVIHGKGHRSEYGPVLKQSIGGWLVQRKDVLAFVSAPQHDGGTGAIYLLLKTNNA